MPEFTNYYAGLASGAISGPALDPQYAPPPKSPSVRRPTPSQVLTSFQSGHGWTNPTIGTLADDTDAADYFIGTQSVSLTTTSGGSVTAQKAGLALDLTDKYLGVWVRIDDITLVDQINVYAGVSGLSSTYIWTFAREAAGSPMFRDGEWQLITLPWPASTTTGSPNRAAIDTIRIRVVAETGVVGLVHLQQVNVYDERTTQYPNGVASIMWDDGYTSTLEAARRSFATYGLRGSVGIIPSSVGTAGFLTLDEIKSLQNDYAWEVVVHASTDFTTQTAAEVEATMIEARTYFMENGLDRNGMDHVVYPGGQVDAATIGVAREFFVSGRAICEPALMESLPPADPFKVRATSGISSFSGGVSAAAVEARIDLAVANHAWLVLVFHRASDSPASTLDCTYANLETIAAKLASSGIEVKPYGEVLASLVK